MSSNQAINLQNIGIIMLAAGSSQRFQGDKRQAQMENGLSLLENSLAQVPDTFSKRLLVLHPGDEALAEKFSFSWDIFIAKEAAQGMGNSLSGAIQSIMKSATKWQGALIGLGDMPFIQPETYCSLQKSLIEHEIVTPTKQGKRGNPVGFRDRYFEEMSRLKGDQGARLLIKKYQSQCYLHELSDDGVFRDIDTVEALKAATTSTGILTR